MEAQQASPNRQQGEVSDTSTDQLAGQQQWANESGSETELVSINSQQHYYEPQSMHYLPAPKQSNKQPARDYHEINDVAQNGCQAGHGYGQQQEPSRVAFAEPNLITSSPFSNGNSVFECYPNEPNGSLDGEANSYRPYADYNHPHSYQHHSHAYNGYAKYGDVNTNGDYYGQRNYFDHQEEANDYQNNPVQEDHYAPLREDKANEQATTTPNYYRPEVDASAGTPLYDPSAETTGSVFEDASTEDYGHSQESSAPGSCMGQQWTNESSGEPELLAINGNHYYDPQQMHYLPATDKQPGHFQHHPVAPPVSDTATIAEQSSMSASFTSVSKYDAGGSLIEYYPSDTSYHETNYYRPYAHYTHHQSQQPTDGYHRHELDSDYYNQQQANGTATGGQHYFEQEEAKTYHLLKQSSQSEANSYARTENGKTDNQQSGVTSTTSYYSTDTDTIPRVSRQYDPNTEISSSLFDDLPTDQDYRNEQVEEEEEDEEEEEEADAEEDEDSLMSSSGSTSTYLAKNSNNGARQRLRLVAAVTTVHHTAGQNKSARCTPETIERLKLFLQRRKQLGGQPPTACLAPFRSCCASTSQAMVTLRARSKNGSSAMKGDQLEHSTRVPSLSCTNKTSCQTDGPNGGGGACAYGRRSSISGTKANSLSSSPSSCNESTCDDSSNSGSRASTVTTFHHHPARTTAIMSENRQLRNRTIVINSSSSSYPNDQPDNDANRDLKRHGSGYGLETRSSKRRRRLDSQDASN